jgi:hypothetical protein
MQMKMMLFTCLIMAWSIDMAWDGEDSKENCFVVLSKGEGQVMAWWPKNLATVKK